MIKIKQHKNLNPKLWAKNNVLKPKVSDTLLKIVSNFLQNLYLKHNIKFEPHEIKDIFVYGSNADYFYTKKSDIDICIVAEFLRLKTQNPFINIKKLLKLCYNDWKKYHHETIYGHSIEISFDDVYCPEHDGRHRVGPQYSLIDEKWIYEHVLLSPKEFRQIYKESDEIYKNFVRKFKSIQKRKDFKELKILYREITALKNFNYSDENNQLISPISITWRRLRNDGIIDKMRTILTNKRSEKLSLK